MPTVDENVAAILTELNRQVARATQEATTELIEKEFYLVSRDDLEFAHSWAEALGEMGMRVVPDTDTERWSHVGWIGPDGTLLPKGANDPKSEDTRRWRPIWVREAAPERATMGATGG